MVSEIPVAIGCSTLEVSRSGYYKWKTAPEAERSKETRELSIRVQEIFDESRCTYGMPRIMEKLRQEGHLAGKMRISKIMQELNISGGLKKKYKVKTTDSNHDLPIAQRVFKTEDESTHAVAPNQIWCGDISYIETEEGFLYLATLVDLYTRKVVGHAMAEHMKTGLLLEALGVAKGRQEITLGLVMHSDRGVQYASQSYRSALSQLKIVSSMSRKGNCYDNAFAESFFATLKKELVYRRKFKTRNEAKLAIFEYIECWYNRERMHSKLGYLSPIQYEEKYYAARE